MKVIIGDSLHAKTSEMDRARITSNGEMMTVFRIL